jgi:hypothetical protein
MRGEYGPKLALSAEPCEQEARDSRSTVRELAETRTTQIEDCGCDRGSAAWRLPRFDAALIVFRLVSASISRWLFPFPS